MRKKIELRCSGCNEVKISMGLGASISGLGGEIKCVTCGAVTKIPKEMKNPATHENTTAG